MMKIPIKPLSVNQSWKGRRFKTKEYKIYEKEMLSRLPPGKAPDSPELQVHLTFGISKRFDIDNGIKPFLDILQKKYGFNDNRIFYLTVEKVIVDRGFEFVGFEIRPSSR